MVLGTVDRKGKFGISRERRVDIPPCETHYGCPAAVRSNDVSSWRYWHPSRPSNSPDNEETYIPRKKENTPPTSYNKTDQLWLPGKLTLI